MVKSTLYTQSFHTRRLAGRLAAIENVFSVTAMQRVWKAYVRPGLRDQEILDLHDFNDVHWDRDRIFDKLHTSLCSGRFTPQQSTPVRVEKRLGVTRTLVLPSPEDCIVLQCIVEYILPSALRKQPSTNSFFSRSHGFSGSSFKFERDYIWFRRWAKFSNVRLQLMSTHSHVCTTDVANYFDNIDYSQLRNIISSIDNIDEVILDILFSVLDRISWRPDYLPSPGRSLPQVNFDAPRLLSHVYLFEVDAYLKGETGDSFVRWVDDITVAVNSHSKGKALLRDIDHLLMTRGLRLNAGKTQILSVHEARRYFHVIENEYLDTVKKRIDRYGRGSARATKLLANVRKRFDKFVSKPGYGHSDKVVKRYLTHFSVNQDSHALRYAVDRLHSEPGLRESTFRYFQAMGPSRPAFRAMQSYLTGEDVLGPGPINRFHRAA